MVYKIETGFSASSGGDDFLQKSMPYPTPLFRGAIPVQMPVTGLSKDEGPESGSKVSYQSTKSDGECDAAIQEEKSNQRANGHELARHNQKVILVLYPTDGYQGRKATLRSRI